MKKSTLRYSVAAATYPQRLRNEILGQRERGSISVETVIVSLGLAALGTAVVGFLLTWAMGKLGGLG